MSRTAVINSLSKGTVRLQDVDCAWWGDIEVVMSALRAPDAGCALYALECLVGGQLLDDECAVLRIVAHNGMLIQYASPRLRANRSVFARAVYSNTDVVEFFGGAFLDDARMMQYAVGLDGMLLEFASPRLRADANMVGVAMAQNVRARAFVLVRV